MGAGTAFIISLIIGPWLIRMLARLKAGQPLRHGDAPSLDSFHGKKAGTPTMGGVLIIFSVVLSSLLWAIPTNGFVLLTLATMCYMGAIGFLDDYLKIRQARERRLQEVREKTAQPAVASTAIRKPVQGLGGRWKLALQTLWVLVAVLVMWYWAPTATGIRNITIPFIKEPVLIHVNFLLAFAFRWLVIVGATNAVNLTDGLDGLAISCTNSVALAYLIMTYIAGHLIFAKYLQVPHVPGSGELTVLCGCLLGAGLGFLWFNCHPARVFMGDTGSLALGGMIAIVAVLISQELVLIVVGGVFVLEALSVLIQVAYFRITGGKRIFRCAPLHHHFELLEKARAEKEHRDVEVVETMITTRFWIISIIFALLGVATLKLR